MYIDRSDRSVRLRVALDWWLTCKPQSSDVSKSRYSIIETRIWSKPHRRTRRSSSTSFNLNQDYVVSRRHFHIRIGRRCSWWIQRAEREREGGHRAQLRFKSRFSVDWMSRHLVYSSVIFEDNALLVCLLAYTHTFSRWGARLLPSRSNKLLLSTTASKRKPCHQCW